MKLWVYIVCTVLCITVLLVWRNLDFLILPKTTQRPLTLSEISTITGINFPEQAKLLNHYEDSYQDYVLYMRFSIPRNELDKMLTSIPFSQVRFVEAEMEYSRFMYGATAYKWWDLTKVKNCKAGSILYDNGNSLVVLIDYDRNDPCVVYIVWMGK
jgi:hypothetical protein